MNFNLFPFSTISQSLYTSERGKNEENRLFSQWSWINENVGNVDELYKSAFFSTLHHEHKILKKIHQNISFPLLCVCQEKNNIYFFLFFLFSHQKKNKFSPFFIIYQSHTHNSTKKWKFSYRFPMNIQLLSFSSVFTLLQKNIQ